MRRLEYHPSHLVRVDKGQWTQLPRTEFLLLRCLQCFENKALSFLRIHRVIWGIPYEPRVSPTILTTRRRLIEKLCALRPDLDWENIIRIDKVAGCGLYMPDKQESPRLISEDHPS